MKRVFNSDEVFLISNNTKKNIEKLEELIAELKINIQNITTYYRGEDANEIVLKYTEIVNYLECIKSNFGNCHKFLSNVCGRYDDSFNSAKTKINSLTPSGLPLETNFESSGLGFDSVTSETIDVFL